MAGEAQHKATLGSKVKSKWEAVNKTEQWPLVVEQGILDIGVRRYGQNKYTRIPKKRESNHVRNSSVKIVQETPGEVEGV